MRFPHLATLATLATQSAGCEVAERLRGRPVMCFHGDADELLPPVCSDLVAGLSGGELVVLPRTGHLMSQAGEELRRRLLDWIPSALR